MQYKERQILIIENININRLKDMIGTCIIYFQLCHIELESEEKLLL